MAQWQRTLDLQPEWDTADADPYAPEYLQPLCRAIAEKLRKLKPFNIPDVDEAKEELIDEFLDAASDAEITNNYFNILMLGLYDWGDTPLDDELNGKKVCWINTM